MAPKKALDIIKVWIEKKMCSLKFAAIFRAIFDLSNKIALLILLWMYALYVEKQKIEEWYF